MRHVSKIAVVGSGPVGIVIANKLAKSIPSDIEIFLIDAGKEEAEASIVDILKRNSVTSRGFTKEHLIKIKEISANNAPSDLVGGYSNFWGATWEPPSRYGSQFMKAYYELENLLADATGDIGTLHYSSVVKHGSSFCQCMSSLTTKEEKNESISIRDSSLLLNKLRFSTLLENEKQSHFSAWNSRSLIDTLGKQDNFNFISNLTVESFKETTEGTILFTSIGKFEFDVVIFACGPLETAKLLMRSLPQIPQILMPETQMSYSLVVRWPSKTSNVEFGLSHIFSETTFEGTKPVEMHTQYYAHLYKNRGLITGRVPWILRMPIAVLLRLFDPFLVVAINYISPEISGYLKIQRDLVNKNELMVSRIESSVHRDQFAKLYRVLSRGLRKFGFITSRWMVFHQAPGKSFHFGASNSGLVNPSGKIVGFDNSYISGAICLPTIHPGPITTAAMSHGVLVANEIIEKYFSAG